MVVLAGGEGRRIGGGKPLRRLVNRTLLEHALALAREWRGLVAVLVRESAQVRDCGDVLILPDREGEGPIAGIATAVHFARKRELDAVLTIPCDAPLLPHDLPKQLADALRPAIGAAVAASGGRLHPSCALWRAEAADALPTYFASGRSSLKGFAAHVGYAAVEWPTDPFDPFFNINSERELAAAEMLFRSR